MPIPVTTTRRSAMWREVEVAKVRVWETEKRGSEMYVQLNE